jgi:hypothetical protein
VSAKGRRRRDSEVGALWPDVTEPASGSRKVNGRDTEFHPTEPWVVEALLSSPLIALPGGLWIEPCAGTGSIVKAVNRTRDVMWALGEIDGAHEPALRSIMRDCDALVMGDWVTSPWPFPMASVLIMNPPFSHATEFVEAAFARAQHVVMLHRGGWFGTPRASWLRKFCPDDLALDGRPSFSGDGATDMSEYSWFYWPPGSRERRCGRIAMLDKPNGGQRDLFDRLDKAGKGAA